LEPKFVAMFGRDKDAIFNRLFSARRQVIVTAETLIEEEGNGPPESADSRAQRVKWRKQIFASPGTLDPEDEVGKLLQQFRNEIEQLCRPIVDRSFKSQGAKSRRLIKYADDPESKRACSLFAFHNCELREWNVCVVTPYWLGRTRIRFRASREFRLLAWRCRTWRLCSMLSHTCRT
jgi:hypothetical protein